MTPELKSILSEIAFPVRYDSLTRNISDKDERFVIARVTTFEHNHAFGEELARLINTLDPKRESEVTIYDLVTDRQINMAWDYANFGDMPKRDVIADVLFKCEAGYHVGKTAKRITNELGLITEGYELTQRGKAYIKALVELEKAKP